MLIYDSKYIISLLQAIKADDGDSLKQNENWKQVGWKIYLFMERRAVENSTGNKAENGPTKKISQIHEQEWYTSSRIEYNLVCFRGN